MIPLYHCLLLGNKTAEVSGTVDEPKEREGSPRYFHLLQPHTAPPPKVPLSLWSAVWPVARDPGPGGRV